MTELTDQNFEELVMKNEKPVVVDFFAEWCSPCFVLTPILEKLSNDFGEKIIFAKANLDKIPLAAQKLGIDRIPTVIIFEKGKAISGFVGLQPEPVIKNWLEKILKKEDVDEIIKDRAPQWRGEGKEEDEVLFAYAEYARQKGFKLNPQKEVVERIVRGLLENEKKYGQRYCPCRRVTGVVENDAKNICPCAFHLEEIEKLGHCLCGLFVK